MHEPLNFKLETHVPHSQTPESRAMIGVYEEYVGYDWGITGKGRNSSNSKISVCTRTLPRQPSSGF